MVSSYLICDLCGHVGPPASMLSEDGLRLCYQCWYEAHRHEPPPATDLPDAPVADAKSDAGTAKH